MKQHELALAALDGGDERGAVLEARPTLNVVAEACRVGEDLPVDTDPGDTARTRPGGAAGPGLGGAVLAPMR